MFSLEKLSYQEVAQATNPESVAAQLKKYNSQIQCLNKVLDKVDNENIQKVKAEATKNINEVLNIELVDCMKIVNEKEQVEYVKFERKEFILAICDPIQRSNNFISMSFLYLSIDFSGANQPLLRSPLTSFLKQPPRSFL